MKIGRARGSEGEQRENRGGFRKYKPKAESAQSDRGGVQDRDPEPSSYDRVDLEGTHGKYDKPTTAKVICK